MTGSLRHAHVRLVTLMVAFACVLAFTAGTSASTPAHAAAPAAGAITLDVQELAGSHAAITDYQYLVTRDVVDHPDQSDPRCRKASNPSYPTGCPWASIAATPGGTAAALVTQGDQADFASGKSLQLDGGKYLISVTSAGHKIDGAHVSVDGGTKAVTVRMQEVPLHTATLRGRVFDDRAGTNGELDEPVEEVTCTGTGAARTCNRDMSGFRAVISDVLQQVTTDVFGNPLCTTYQKADASGNAVTSAGNPVAADQHQASPDRVYLDGSGKAVVVDLGAGCFSDVFGNITIPNLGPNRYAFQAVPPAGSDWIQTSTLEGGHDWDTWLQEGATGFDTEAVGLAGEPVPATRLGYVHGGTAPTYRPFTGTAAGQIKGVAVAVKAYIPGVGGITQAGIAGAKVDAPVNKPWVAIDDLNNGDQQRAVVRGGTDGTFALTHVPDGDYQVTVWDQEQNLILQNEQVSVRGGEVADLGTVRLAKWFSEISGTIFTDANANGRQDPGEAGIPNFVVTLKVRDNSTEDQGQNSATTDANGHYLFKQAYPLGYWLVLEAYNQRYQTTGYTAQADNEPQESSHVGGGVDVNVLNIIGLSERVDWGVQRYAAGTNGGIVGSVTYDTTRNETDARKAATEPYQAGIPGLDVNLYQATPCTVAGYSATDGSTCVLHEGNKAFVTEPDGSVRLGKQLNTYVSESWDRPVGCTARDVDGNPVALTYMPDGSGSDCLESPSMGAQAKGGAGDDFATVNGNYGFTQRWRLDANGDYVPCDSGYTSTDGSSCDTDHGGRVLENLPPATYLVRTVIPKDTYGRDKFQVTKEEDINVFTGDSYTPNIPEPECAGAQHKVTVSSNPADASPLYQLGQPVYNPDFAANGGSPYEGQNRPLCDVKLIPVSNGVSVAPSFALFTSVPLPGIYHALVVDDLNVSGNPADIYYGEKAGIPDMPIGLYDNTGRLVYTGTTDPNGTFDAMMPSTSTYNCPLPAGPCPNVYRFVANDPGQPGAPNPNFNANYRSIATEFSLWPNETLPADLAPVTVATIAANPGGTQNLHPATCLLPGGTPRLFSVDKPVLTPAAGTTAANVASRTVVLTGQDFGTTPGAVLIDGVPATTAAGAGQQLTTTWTDTKVTLTFSSSYATNTGLFVGSGGRGPHLITLRAANQKVTTPGVTLRLVGGVYAPKVYQVGPGQTYATIQAGVDAAGTLTATTAAGRLAQLVAMQLLPPVVQVHPGTPTPFNPRGAYQENVVLHRPVVLQGYGPGDPTKVDGTVIDGSGFASTTVATAWRAKTASFTWSGNQQPFEGAAVSVFASQAEWLATNSTYRPGIDGMTITGGDTLDFPNTVKSGGGAIPTIAVAQGGGVYLNGYDPHVQLSNVTFDGNAGAYGGAIRSGTPFEAGGAHNGDLKIVDNAMIHNGGSALAGAVGLFSGNDAYEFARNDLCGNYSAEYGGGLSQYGRGTGTSRIHDNRIWDNASYDEGAGIMVAGELPANPNNPSTGAGTVSIYGNLVHENLSGDDGGGIRLLQAGRDPIRIFNNQITDNVSTHEGGGIALDDAADVRIFDNTIAKNVTTATAATSDGLPAPAGLSTGQLSDPLRAQIGAGAPTFANPTMLYGNLFNDNRAATFTGTAPDYVSGLSDAGADVWDLGVADGAGSLSPRYSVLTNDQSAHGTVTASSTNRLTTAPAFSGTGADAPYPPTVVLLPFTGNINFISSYIVGLDNATQLKGGYHVQTASPAVNGGNVTELNAAVTRTPVASFADQATAKRDIDAEQRGGTQIAPAAPVAGTPDIGMDEAVR